MNRVNLVDTGALRIGVRVVSALVLLAFSAIFSTRLESATRRSAASAQRAIGTQRIDQEIEQSWKEAGITPSDKATDGAWCRRVYLDVIGRIPTAIELRDFTRSRRRNKRVELVDELLRGERYADEYVRNWTTLWTNILIGRTGGTERNSMTSRTGMQDYLRASFTENRPYDRMVYELVTATGATVPGKEDFNGATNFLVAKINDEKATLATAATARIFLGMQVQCTQCHNHPFNDWKQRKFWELNAFFRQTRANRIRDPETRRTANAILADRDFPGEGSTPNKAEIYYELRNGEMRVAYPVFVNNRRINPDGHVQAVDRRQELGKLIVNSPMLETMMVNRMWAHFMGYGFTKPIDDLGSHNPASHPDLLEGLAQDFRQASFDAKRLIRWIVLSRPYALSSKTNKTNAEADDPALGEPPKFSHFYLRQMEAEQLYESLLIATEADTARGDYAAQERTKSQWLQQFTTAFGTDEGGESTTFNGTIPQTLMLFNGDLIQRAISLDANNMLRKVVDSNMTAAQKIDYLFLTGLSRNASPDEISVANQLLLMRKGNGAEALQDIWWALLNSNEFIMNH